MPPLHLYGTASVRSRLVKQWELGITYSQCHKTQCQKAGKESLTSCKASPDVWRSADEEEEEETVVEEEEEDKELGKGKIRRRRTMKKIKRRGCIGGKG